MKKVIVVNDKNEVIGSEDLITAFKKVMIRRIARVFIKNSEGKIFLQRRSDNSPWFPDVWDNSAGGHVDEGEDYETAAARELHEEIGVKDVKLEKIASFFNEEEYNNQPMKSFDELYLAEYDGEFNLDPHEVKGGGWFSLEEVNKMIKDNPDELAPGLIKSIKTLKY